MKIDVYGDGPYKSILKDLIKKNNLNSNVIIKGSVPNLKSTYYLYDYMLQPTHMECFSLSILESLAANVPVVTTNVGGNEEAIKHKRNGFIYKVKNVKELSEILEKMLKEEVQIKEETRNLIESTFSLNEMVKNHFKLLS